MDAASNLDVGSDSMAAAMPTPTETSGTLAAVSISADREPEITPALATPGEAMSGNPPSKRWYLGIDIGVTELSAAFWDTETAQLYPVTWGRRGPDGEQRLLRLPVVAYLAAEQLGKQPDAPAAVGDRVLKSGMVTMQQADDATAGLLLGSFQHYLNVTIPYFSSQSETWEPIVQWSDQRQVSLTWIGQAMMALLETLREQQPDAFVCVEGMPPAALSLALTELAGVVIGYPTGWSDAYCFNLREAVLAAGLVTKPEHIFFMETAIATLLSQLPDPVQSQPASVPATPLTTPRPTEPSWEGGTLVLNTVATTTELLLVDLPFDSHTLFREDLHSRSLPFGSMAIDQDIICQMFYPSVWGWRHLGAPRLDLPLPGEPDLPVRHRFQQRLRSNCLGRDLLRTARQVKRILQHQDATTFYLNEQQWTVNQAEFYSRVLVPYIQLLNRELNTLLAQTGMVVQSVQRVLCAGEIGMLPAIAQWLKQKFPNANLIQAVEPLTATCSYTACGLARLPLFTQVLNAAQHQYSDYFLLREMLRILPSQPLSLGHILQLLENQGINTQACQRTILNLLEGQLPAGLIPTDADLSLLSSDSTQNPDYRAIAQVPLFTRQGNQVYSLNSEQRDHLQQYLSNLLSRTRQTLAEPLTVDFDTQVVV